MLFVGIDPGANGGLAWISSRERGAVAFSKLSEEEQWAFIHLQGVRAEAYSSVRVVIERQTPRPTRWYSPKAKMMFSGILASTCELYGHYQMLRGFLVASGLKFDEAAPQTWQAALSLHKEKGEGDTKWKNRLKSLAQRLFPSEKIILATADAYLLAEYARRRHHGEV